MTLENFRKVKIILNHADDPILQKITAKEGDENGRALEVQLSNGGATQDLSGINLVFYWKHLKKGNSGNLFFEPVDVSKGTFLVNYPSSMMSEGRVSCHVAIVDASKESVTRTREFLVLVDGSGYDAHAELASNDFQAANDMLIEFVKYQAEIDGIKADLRNQGQSLIGQERAKFEQLFNEIQPQMDGLERQFNDAIANITQDSEVIVGRTSTVTGDSYASIGKRLDEMETMTVLENHKAYFEIKDGRPRLRLEEI